jgi:hypothetical protein
VPWTIAVDALRRDNGHVERAVVGVVFDDL